MILATKEALADLRPDLSLSVIIVVIFKERMNGTTSKMHSILGENYKGLFMHFPGGKPTSATRVANWQWPAIFLPAVAWSQIHSSHGKSSQHKFACCNFQEDQSFLINMKSPDSGLLIAFSATWTDVEAIIQSAKLSGLYDMANVTTNSGL